MDFSISGEFTDQIETLIIVRKHWSTEFCRISFRFRPSFWHLGAENSSNSVASPLKMAKHKQNASIAFWNWPLLCRSPRSLPLRSFDRSWWRTSLIHNVFVALTGTNQTGASSCGKSNAPYNNVVFKKCWGAERTQLSDADSLQAAATSLKFVPGVWIVQP